MQFLCALGSKKKNNKKREPFPLLQYLHCCHSLELNLQHYQRFACPEHLLAPRNKDISMIVTVKIIGLKSLIICQAGI